MTKEQKQKHFKKALSKSLAPVSWFIKKFNKANMSKILYVLVVIYILAMPVEFDGREMILYKYWPSIMLMDKAFRFNYQKIFFHKMSKKALYIPHELAHIIPNLIIGTFGYLIIDTPFWALISIAILFGALIIINIPLYIVLHKRGDGYTVWVRNLFSFLTSALIVAPALIMVGIYAIYSYGGVDFFGTYASNIVVLLILLPIMCLANFLYYYLVKKFIWVFVKDEKRRDQVLLGQ